MLSPSPDRKSISLLALGVGAGSDFELIPQIDPKIDALSPSGIRFRPDFGMSNGDANAFVHIFAGNGSDLPDRVVESASSFTANPNTSLTILAMAGEEENSTKTAGRIAQACLQNGFGLAIQVGSIAHLIFPPSYALPAQQTSPDENGHIPRWSIQLAIRQRGIGDYLRELLIGLDQAYCAFTSPPSYEDERRVLMALADKLAQGISRIFFPVNRLNVLAEYETTAIHAGRDHFFHTFNDWLLGCAIIGGILGDDRVEVEPDSYVADAMQTGGLSVWEALWTLTAMFHDPGYLAERQGSLLNFAFGIPLNPGEPTSEITEVQAQQVLGAWDTTFRDARLDLLELWGRVSSSFFPGGSETAERLDSALRQVYFDGQSIGHSVASALALVNRCRRNPAFTGKDYDHERAIIACEIAGLSMIFHDQDARDKLRKSGFRPLPFERLPYPCVLAFVDALQDDRRDVARAVWPARGMLQSIDIDAEAKRVVATVDLCQIPIDWWPWKIDEYENVLEWLNSAGSVRFEIDYKTGSGLSNAAI